MQIETNAENALEKAKELLDVFAFIEEKADDLKNKIGFYTIDDVCNLTGISRPKVAELFNRPDFPVCDYGKSKVVFIPAFYEYFMHPVKTTDFI